MIPTRFVLEIDCSSMAFLPSLPDPVDSESGRVARTRAVARILNSLYHEVVHSIGSPQTVFPIFDDDGNACGQARFEELVTIPATIPEPNSVTYSPAFREALTTLIDERIKAHYISLPPLVLRAKLERIVSPDRRLQEAHEAHEASNPDSEQDPFDGVPSDVKPPF